MDGLPRAWMPRNMEMPERKAFVMGLTSMPKADHQMLEVLMVGKLTRLIQEYLDEGGTYPEDLIESCYPDLGSAIRMEGARTAREIASAMVYRADRLNNLLSSLDATGSNKPNPQAATVMQEQTLQTWLEDLNDAL